MKKTQDREKEFWSLPSSDDFELRLGAFSSR